MKIFLYPGEAEQLASIQRQTHGKSSTKLRSGAVYLLAVRGLRRCDLMRDYGYTGPFIDRWVERWTNQKELRAEWSKQSQQIGTRKYRKLIAGIFGDRSRSGAPRYFDEKIREKVLALAASDPQSLGLPYSKWSHELLAQQVVERKIADRMSSTRVGDFLKSGRTQAP